MKKIILKSISAVLTAVLFISFVFASCSSNSYDTVMEYNGIKVTEDMYNYWVSTYKRNILAYTKAKDADEFWKSEFNESQTVEEYYSQIINEKIMDYLIAQSIYKDERLKLSDSVRSVIEQDINEKIDYYGGKSSLNKELASIMLDVQSLEDIYTWEQKHGAVLNYLFGSGGKYEINDSHLNDYYTSNYSRIKYIVFYTTAIELDENGKYVYDNDGNLVTKELTDQEMKDKLAKIDKCLEDIDSGMSFDSAASEYSEFDTSSYQSGFFVSDNETATWGNDIIEAVKSADVGKTFKVEEDSAIYIIQKLPLIPLDNMSESELAQISNITDHIERKVTKEYFEKLYSGVTVNEKLTEKYSLSKIKPNPLYNF